MILLLDIYYSDHYLRIIEMVKLEQHGVAYRPVGEIIRFSALFFASCTKKDKLLHDQLRPTEEDEWNLKNHPLG